MKYNSFPFLCITVITLSVAACGSDSGETDNRAPETVVSNRIAADGIYSVIRTADTEAEAGVVSEGELLLIYDGRYTGDGSTDDTTWVVLDARDPVPLLLEGTPDKRPDDRGHTLLSVTLQKKQAAALEKFTERHLNERVATLIDGEVVTMHRVRAVITGGRIQITRCTDNACEVLYSKLMD